MTSARSKVFISYSHADAPWLEKVRKALKPLEKDHGDAIWHDQKLEPGSAWGDEIQGAIDSAKVAVLLVSRDFMASDFIGGKELPPLLKAAQEDGAVILPLHLGRSAFVEDKHLGKIQGVNDPGKPLKAVSEDEQDQALENLRRCVHKALQGPAAIAAAAKSVAVAAKLVASAAQTVAEAAQTAADAPAPDDDTPAEDEAQEYELVEGLAQNLEDLTADASELAGVAICATDSRGETAPLMRLEFNEADELVLVIPSTAELPDELELAEDMRERLTQEFGAEDVGQDDDDDAQEVNFGPASEVDLEVVHDTICSILDDIFELPDDDFGLVAMPAEE